MNSASGISKNLDPVRVDGDAVGEGVKVGVVDVDEVGDGVDATEACALLLGEVVSLAPGSVGRHVATSTTPMITTAAMTGHDTPPRRGRRGAPLGETGGGGAGGSFASPGCGGGTVTTSGVRVTLVSSSIGRPVYGRSPSDPWRRRSRPAARTSVVRRRTPMQEARGPWRDID